MSLIAEISTAILGGISFGLGVLVLLLLAQLLMRRESWAAVIVTLLFSIAFTWLLPGEWYITWFAHLFNTAAIVFLATRFGVFSAVISYIVIILLSMPITSDSSAFYFTNGLFVMLLVLGVAGYGWYISTDWRTLDRGALASNECH